MKRFAVAVLTFLAASLALAGQARAAPAEDDSGTGGAAATINRLKASGTEVAINRIGNAPLDECRVTSVSNFSRPAQMIPITENDINVFTRFPKPKVTVTLNCAR